MSDLTRRQALKVGGAAAGLLGFGVASGDQQERQQFAESKVQSAEDGTLVGTWTSSQHLPGDDGLSQEGLSDQTLREVAHTSVGGSDLQVRLANTFNENAVTFEEVTVGVREEDATVLEDTLQQVTFSNESAVTVRPGARAYSDPVSLDVDPMQDLVVSVYAPDDTGPTTWHSFGKDTAFTAEGNQTAQTEGDDFSATGPSYYFLDEVDVVAPEATGAVVAIGDSITDGVGSTVAMMNPSDAELRSAGPNNAYPDYLAGRINDSHEVQLSTLNAGIGGNRILHDSPSDYTFGPSALARLDRDVLAQTGVSDVILLEGINDIGFSASEDLAPDQAVTADQIIDGMQQIIARAHAKRARIFGATLTPFKGAAYCYEEGEEKRQTVNHFIRESGEFDGVFDFDEAIQDPENPKRLLPKYDSGDNLHPSDAGYQEMAQTVDLEALSGGQ